MDVVATERTVTANQWTHVVAIYGNTGGGGTLHIYVNGELWADRVTLGRYAAFEPRPDTDLTMTRMGSSELLPDGRRLFLRFLDKIEHLFYPYVGYFLTPQTCSTIP